MRIIISGGLGYIGGRLSKFLADSGYVVTALSRKAKSLPDIEWPAGLHIMHPDEVMENPELLKKQNVFIHLAALNEIDSERNPELAVDVNVNQTARWLDLAFKAEIRQFVYFSTAHVYARPLTGYFNEESPTRPGHPYAETHKRAEGLVLDYGAAGKSSSLVLRLTNAFGCPAFPTADRWTLLVNDLCRSAVTSGKITLRSDGRQQRDFVCLSDVCRATLHLMPAVPDESGIFNLGGRSMSIGSMAEMVRTEAERFLGKPVELIQQAVSNSTENKIESLKISSEKLFNTGYKLIDDPGQEIRATLDYFAKHPS